MFNVLACFHAPTHAARVINLSKKGSIIFTSSVASVTYGYVPRAYVASKTALVGLRKNLYIELGKRRIRVNCISPFGVATPVLMTTLKIPENEK